MSSVEQVRLAIAEGDSHIISAPVQPATEAVRVVGTHGILLSLGRIIAVLQGVRSRDIPEAQMLAVNVSEQAKVAEICYAGALDGSAGLDMFDVQVNAMALRAGGVEVYGTVSEMGERVEVVLGHLMAAASVLQECDGLHAKAMHATAAAVTAQSATLGASNTYRKNCLTG